MPTPDDDLGNDFTADLAAKLLQARKAPPTAAPAAQFPGAGELTEQRPSGEYIGPEGVQSQTRKAFSAASDFAARTQPLDELPAETQERVRLLTEAITASQPPPDPNMSVSEAIPLAIRGNEAPIVADLPYSERAMYEFERALPPGASRLPEAIRTGDVAGAAKRNVEDVVEAARVFAIPAEAADRLFGTNLIPPEATPSLEDLATRKVRIGEDVVPVESPSARTMRLAAGLLQGAVSSSAHQVLKTVSPSQAADLLLGFGAKLPNGDVYAAPPQALLHAIAGTTPGQMLANLNPEAVRVAGNVLTLGGGPAALVANAGEAAGVDVAAELRGAAGKELPGMYGRTVSPTIAGAAAGLVERAKGYHGAGNLASSWVQNPDRPFITPEAEVAERGEQPWNASKGWLPQWAGDPIVGYLQDLSRGRGTTPIFSEMSVSAGYGPGTPEYFSMTATGVFAEFVPTDVIPIEAISKAWTLGKVALAARGIGSVVPEARAATMFQSTVLEFFAQGGSVDGVRPASDAMRIRLAQQRPLDVWANVQKQMPQMAEGADRVFADTHKMTIAEYLEGLEKRGPVKSGPPTGQPLQVPENPAPAPAPEPLRQEPPTTIGPNGPQPLFRPRAEPEVVIGKDVPTYVEPEVPQFERIPDKTPEQRFGVAGEEWNLPPEVREEDVVFPPGPKYNPDDMDALMWRVASRAEADLPPPFENVYARWAELKEGSPTLIDEAMRPEVKRIWSAEPEPVRAPTIPPTPKPDPWTPAGHEPDVGVAYVDIANEVADEVMPAEVHDQVVSMLADPTEGLDVTIPGQLKAQGRYIDATLPGLERTLSPTFARGGRPRAEQQTGLQYLAGESKYLAPGARLPGGSADPFKYTTVVYNPPELGPVPRGPTRDTALLPGEVPEYAVREAKIAPPGTEPAPVPAAFTPDEAAMDVAIRDPKRTDMMIARMEENANPAMDAATHRTVTAWIDQMKASAQAIRRPDLREATLAEIAFMDPRTSLAEKWDAVLRIGLYRGTPVSPATPMGEIMDAVRAGRVTAIDGMRAMARALQPSGQFAAGIVPNLRQAAIKWGQALAKDQRAAAAAEHMGVWEEAIKRGGNDDEILASIAKARQAGDVGPDTLVEEFVVKAKKAAAKIRHDVGRRYNDIIRADKTGRLTREAVEAQYGGRVIVPQLVRDLIRAEYAADDGVRAAARLRIAEQSTRGRIRGRVLGEALAPAEHMAPSDTVTRVAHALGADGHTRPDKPHDAIYAVLGDGVQPRMWDESKVARHAHGGAYDPGVRLMEPNVRDLDGKKYRLVDVDGRRPPGKLTLTGDAADDLDALHEMPPRAGMEIRAAGSERPIARWDDDGRLVAHELGATPEEARVVQDFASRRGPLKPKEEALYWPTKLRSGLAPEDLPNLAGPKHLPLTPELEPVAKAIEEAMRGHMRSRLGYTQLVPIIGDVVVTRAERTRIMETMRRETGALYDLDEVYGKGPKLDEVGNLVLNDKQKLRFWTLAEKYGVPVPDDMAGGYAAAVSPEATRAMHRAMARELAGRGAWMELAIKDMSPWARMTESVLRSATEARPGEHVREAPPAKERTWGAAFIDVDRKALERSGKRGADILDHAVHRLSAVSADVARKVDGLRYEGAEQVAALKTALADTSFKPISGDMNDLIDLAQAPGIPLDEFMEVGRQAAEVEYPILSGRLKRMADAAKDEQSLAEFGMAWAKQRAQERRDYARMWLKANAPGFDDDAIEATLRTLGQGDAIKGADRLYHDAFVRPTPDAFVPSPPGWRTTAKEWFKGGGALRYQGEAGTLGKALKVHGGSWQPLAEDEVLFNFIAQLHADQIRKETVAMLVKNELGLPAGRFADLVNDILYNPEAGAPAFAAERGYTPTDLLSAHRAIEKMGLRPGSRQVLEGLEGSAGVVEDVEGAIKVPPYFRTMLQEAKAFGLDDAMRRGGVDKLVDVVLATTEGTVPLPADLRKMGSLFLSDLRRYWRTNALGLLGVFFSPAYSIGNTLGAGLTTFMTRGIEGVADVAGTLGDVRAWGLSAEMAEMRARKWNPLGRGIHAAAKWGKQDVFVFPTGVWSRGDLVDAFRARGLDAQAARVDNAAALIDDMRRHDYGAFRQFVAVDDYVQAANEVQNAADMSVRVRIALGELKRGASIDDACRAAREVIYDYSGLTKFERDYMRAVVPFYTFFKRNSEALLRAMLENPQRVTYLARLADKQPELWGMSDQQKNAMRSGQWGKMIIGKDEGHTMDYDARYYTTTSMNPVDGLLLMQALLDLRDPQAVAKEAISHTYPWVGQPIDWATETVTRTGQPLFSDRANEVPAWMMEDPHIAVWLKQSFGVDAVGFSQGDVSEATSFDELGRPQRWVIGKAYERDGDPELARQAMLEWRAVLAFAGREPERLREIGAVFDPNLRPVGQSPGGAGLEFATGAGSFETLTDEADLERLRKQRIRELQEAQTRILGPANPQGPVAP